MGNSCLRRRQQFTFRASNKRRDGRMINQLTQTTPKQLNIIITPAKNNQKQQKPKPQPLPYLLGVPLISKEDADNNRQSQNFNILPPIEGIRFSAQQSLEQLGQNTIVIQHTNSFILPEDDRPNKIQSDLSVTQKVNKVQILDGQGRPVRFNNRQFVQVEWQQLNKNNISWHSVQKSIQSIKYPKLNSSQYRVRLKHQDLYYEEVDYPKVREYQFFPS